jgi:hypothetical protein
VQVLIRGSLSLFPLHSIFLFAFQLVHSWSSHGAVQNIRKTCRKSESLLYCAKVFCQLCVISLASCVRRQRLAPRQGSRCYRGYKRCHATLKFKRVAQQQAYDLEFTLRDHAAGFNGMSRPVFASFPCHDIFCTTWRQFLGRWARSCASHSSGYESPTTITPRCCRRRENPQLLAPPPFPESVMLTRLRFLPFSALSFCTCFLNVSMIVAAARRALLSSRSRHLQRQREQRSS